MEFRPSASHNLSIKRGQRDVQLYPDTLTGIPKAMLCKACCSSDHVTDSWPPSPRSTDSSGPKRGDLYFNFNKGVPPAPTLTNAISLDVLQPTQERTTLTPQALDPPSQRLAAQAIPPEAAIEYLSNYKLSPTAHIDLQATRLPRHLLNPTMGILAGTVCNLHCLLPLGPFLVRQTYVYVVRQLASCLHHQLQTLQVKLHHRPCSSYYDSYLKTQLFLYC